MTSWPSTLRMSPMCVHKACNVTSSWSPAAFRWALPRDDVRLDDAQQAIGVGTLGVRDRGDTHVVHVSG